MKKAVYFLISVAAVMAAAVSCTQELMHPEEGPMPAEAVMYSASFDSEGTKAVLDGLKSMWNGEEWIQIVGRNGNYWLGSSSSSPSASATFTYDGANGELNENDVFAVYPAGGSNYGRNFDDMCVTNVTVPSNQTP